MTERQVIMLDLFFDYDSSTVHQNSKQNFSAHVSVFTYFWINILLATADIFELSHSS